MHGFLSSNKKSKILRKMTFLATSIKTIPEYSGNINFRTALYVDLGSEITTIKIMMGLNDTAAGLLKSKV